MKRLTIALLCGVISLPARATEFNPETHRYQDAGKSARPSAKNVMSLDSALLKSADKVGADGLTPAGKWLKENTYAGADLVPRELRSAGRTALDDLFAAPDRMNRSWENDWGVLLKVSSAEKGGSAIFGKGEFIEFSRDLIQPAKGARKNQGSLGKLLNEKADVEMEGYLSIFRDSVLKSPDKFEFTYKAPDGTVTRRVMSEKAEVALDFKEGSKAPPSVIRLDEPVQAPAPGGESIVVTMNRAGTRIADFGKGIWDFWAGLGDSGRVRIGKGLSVEKATENLRYVELPAGEVKGFRRSMSESQLRSVAGKSWEEATQALPARHADKLTAIEQTWSAAATKSEMAIVVMEPKAGSALEFAMNRTSPKDMLIKSKVDPITRRVLFDWKNPEHVELLRTGRYTVHHGDGYKYIFDKQAGKPVSSDFDLATVGSKKDLGPVTGDSLLGYSSDADIRAMNTSLKVFESRGYTDLPIAHGPQSNVGLPVRWGTDRMQGYLPGEARAYLIDSPKALGDFLNAGAEKGYKFRIPDQWGVQEYLKPGAKKAVEIVKWEDLPKVGQNPTTSILDDVTAPPIPDSVRLKDSRIPGKLGNEGKISTDVFYSVAEAPKKMWRQIGKWWQGEGIAQPKPRVEPIKEAPPLTPSVPSGIGLAPFQVDRIQAFADKYEVRVTVVGSRAAGTAHANSDFDYIVQGNSKIRSAARRELPKGKSGGEIRMDGTRTGRNVDPESQNPVIKNLPHITFEPRKRS